MHNKLKPNFVLAVILSFVIVNASAAPVVEVLHWWTSAGQAKAVKSLKDDFESQGGKWIDSPIAGGGGDQMNATLRARALAENPPAAVQLKGPKIQEWAELGMLANLDSLAKSEKWEAVLPPQIADTMKYKGHWVAAPVNIHRLDWMWVSPAVLKKSGVASVPKTWDQFNAAAKKIKDAGFIPLAHGGQPWQDSSLWEVVVVSLGGPEFHHKALVELDMDALGSPTMEKVFDQMRILRGFVDSNYPGRDWNLASNMVMNGQAAFQFQGDWVKAEFELSGKKAGKDFLCASPPGGDDSYLYIVDSFAMFKVKGKDQIDGQNLFAKLLMRPKFQETFNLYKGSIPVRTDIGLKKFDSCARDSLALVKKTSAKGGFLPSVVHDMAQRSSVKGAMQDIATEHFNSDMSSKDAVKKLVATVKEASKAE